MKSVKLIFLSLFGLLLINACDSEEESLSNPLDKGNEVKFQATIGVAGPRASGTSWGMGDAIGVYALNGGTSLPSGLYEGKANIKYTTPGTGAFTAATVGIPFPETGALDFIAYYPHQEVIEDYTYKIDVADQSNPGEVDLLYSDNAKGATMSASAVNLEFKHMLSQLVLNVTAGDGVTSLEGLTVTVKNLKTDGTFNLTDATITTGTTTSDIAATVNVTGTSGTVTAILVPGQDLKNAVIVFRLAGQEYEWKPDDMPLEPRKKYTYPIQLTTTGPVVQPNATIVDWIDGYKGTDPIILTPDETDDEYWTIAELRSKYIDANVTITDDVKVKAVVVQNVTGGNSISKKNIVVQDETAGIALRLVDDNETLDFGDEVEISLKDQQLSAYNGLLQINELPNANVTKTGTTTVVAKAVSAADFLAGKYESQYIVVSNVQVTDADLTKTFATSGAHGSINMEFESGETFVMFTSRYAAFITETVPQGSGTLKGIASVNGITYQILPTVLADCDEMTGARFGVTNTLSVSPGAIQFEAASGDTKTIAVTASGAWTATTEGAGFTISPASGTGDVTVTATAAGASGASGKIIFTLDGTTITKEVTVSQKTGGGTPEVFYSETFTNATPLKVKFNSEGTSISGFDFSDGKYTGTGADVRNTSNIDNHIWFPAHNASYEDAYVKISNIPSGYTQIKLTYDVAANAANIPAARLMVKCNDTDITLSDVVLGNTNAYSTITLDIPMDDVTTLEFYTDNSNSSGLRVDNIKLEGVRK